MEVRCGKCNKLFRVSDDKITGTGIKFPCTRCGEYVRITRQDFEHYTLLQGGASVPDLFETSPGPVAAALSPETTAPVARETAPPELESQTFDLAAQATHDDVSEEKPPMFIEPDRLPSASAPESEPAVEIKPEPLMQPKPATAPPVESQPEPKPEPLFVPKQKAKPAVESETLPVPAGPTPPGSPLPETPVQTAVPKKEDAAPSAPAASAALERPMREPILPAAPSRSGSLFYILIAILIVLGLAGYGIFVSLQPPPQKMQEAAREMISNEGLQIVNPVGSMEANGDLFITGVIQNTAEKERTAWYVVTEIYNAQGAVLSKIRLLNGKQIYSPSDYDILARRGANIQELKAKNLQDKDVVIPPKGTVNFAIHCLQPPAGIASFIAQAQSFDPVQLQKEIAGEISSTDAKAAVRP